MSANLVPITNAISAYPMSSLVRVLDSLTQRPLYILEHLFAAQALRVTPLDRAQLDPDGQHIAPHCARADPGKPRGRNLPATCFRILKSGGIGQLSGQ